MRDVVEEGGTFFDAATKRPVSQREIMPDRLMAVELPLVAIGECRARNAGVPAVIDERNVCAGAAGGGKDVCHGDSGGPLVGRDGGGRWVQIAVTSWGQGCARPDLPGVNTRVSAFAGWIRETTRGEAPCSRFRRHPFRRPRRKRRHPRPGSTMRPASRSPSRRATWCTSATSSPTASPPGGPAGS